MAPIAMTAATLCERACPDVAEQVHASMDQSVRQLRDLLQDCNLGQGLKPLLGCLEGALDQHLQPARPPHLPLLIPLLVHGANGGDPADAVPISVVAGLLFLCFDLLDDLQDGDQRPWWGETSKSSLMLAAAAFPSALPQKLLLQAGGAERGATLINALGDGLLNIAEGQALDLQNIGGTNVNLDVVEESVAGKSGAQMGLYARLAALHAGCDLACAELWAGWAHGIGVAGQLGSDMQDLLDPDWSRDLAAGARTLPVGFALKHSRIGREDLLRLLDHARTDRAAQLAARDCIVDSGALLFAGFRSQVHLARSEEALRQLPCSDAWRRMCARLSESRTTADLLRPGAG